MTHVDRVATATRRSDDACNVNHRNIGRETA